MGRPKIKVGEPELTVQGSREKKHHHPILFVPFPHSLSVSHSPICIFSLSNDQWLKKHGNTHTHINRSFSLITTKTEKEKEMMGNKKERELAKFMASNLLQPYPTIQRNTNPFSFSVIKMCSPICPSATPPTIASSSSLSLKTTIFFTQLCGLRFGFYLSWSEYHRENRKARRTFSVINLLVTFTFCCCCCWFFVCGLLCYFLIWWRRWKGLCLRSIHLMVRVRIRRLVSGIRVFCAIMKTCTR